LDTSFRRNHTLISAEQWLGKPDREDRESKMATDDFLI
jgi:hypothetical protein